MGILIIKTEGSFGKSEKVFQAIDHGHAHCVNDAIKYLTELQAKSINQDHELHETGNKPNKGFTKE